MIVPALPQAPLSIAAAFTGMVSMRTASLRVASLRAASLAVAFMGTMCVGAVFTPGAADPAAPPVPSVNYPSRDPDTRLPDRVPLTAERQPREEPAPAAVRSDSVIEYRYVAGAWGHWGHDRRFHAAPAAIARELEERRHGFPGGPVPQAFPGAGRTHPGKTIPGTSGPGTSGPGTPGSGIPGVEETRRVNGLPNEQRGGIVSPVPMPREYRPPR